VELQSSGGCAFEILYRDVHGDNHSIWASYDGSNLHFHEVDEVFPTDVARRLDV
jgi:hypothetical protein